MKALTDDELIEDHLKTLAKWTVQNICTLGLALFVTSCSKLVIRKMVCCLSVLATFRISKYLKLLVLYFIVQNFNDRNLDFN